MKRLAASCVALAAVRVVSLKLYTRSHPLPAATTRGFPAFAITKMKGRTSTHLLTSQRRRPAGRGVELKLTKQRIILIDDASATKDEEETSRL